MGAQASMLSLSATGTMVIKVDQPTVIAGSTLTGNVYLDVRKPTECTSLVLAISGSEKTCVHYTTTHTSGTGKNRKTKTTHHYARARSYFLNVSCPIADVPNGIMPVGNYVFPFSCLIPFGVPSTIVVPGRSNCEVLYTVDGCLSRPGMTQWDIKDSCSFVVHSAAPQISTISAPLYMEPEFHQVTSFCCFNRGRMVIGGSASSSILSPGDNMQVKYCVKNHSTVQVKRIHIALVEFVSMRAHGHRNRKSTTLFEHMLEASAENNETKISDDDLAALKKRTDAALLDDDMLLRGMKKLLDSNETATQLTLPLSARASYDGNLIQVTHMLNIQVFTTFGTANPVIGHPLSVVNRVARLDYTPFVAEATEILSVDQQVPPASAPPLTAAGSTHTYNSLPPGWTPVTAAVYVTPTPYALAVPYEIESLDDQLQQQHQMPPLMEVSAASGAFGVMRNPTGGATVAKNSTTGTTYAGTNSGIFDPAGKPLHALLQALPESFGAVSLLEQWLVNNPTLAGDIPSKSFGELMQAFKYPYDQIQVAELLARYANDKKITCESIVLAVRSADVSVRRDIVDKLAGGGMTVIDKQNSMLVQQCLSPFQYMCVEMYFK